MKTRICINCKKRKYLKNFHKKKNRPGNVRAICKICRSKTRIDKNTAANKKAKARYRKSKNGRLHDLIYRKKNKHKIRARSIINHLLHTKKLIPKKCERCSRMDTEAHHDNYSKPLKIRWLCPKHHTQWHLTHTAKD